MPPSNHQDPSPQRSAIGRLLFLAELPILIFGLLLGTGTVSLTDDPATDGLIGIVMIAAALLGLVVAALFHTGILGARLRD